MGAADTETVQITQLNLNGTITGLATLIITDALNWAGGTMSGAGVTRIPAGAALNLTSANTKSQITRLLESLGTITWSDGAWNLSDGAEIDNQATFEWQTDDNLSWANQGESLTNSGTITKSGGAATKVIAPPFDNSGTLDIQSGAVQTAAFTNTGTVDIGSGTTLSLPGTSTLDNTITIAADGLLAYPTGSHTWIGGFAPLGGGPINVGGTVTMGAADTETVQIAQLNLSGTITGLATLVITDALNWTSGTMSGAGVTRIPVNAALNLTTGNTKSQITRLLESLGTITWSDGAWNLSDGAEIDNQATFEWQTDDNLSWANQGESLTNSGTITKSGGAATKVIAPPFDNSGTLDIQLGAVSPNNDFTHASGALLRGSGTLNLTSANLLGFNGSVTPGPDLAAGTLNITRTSLTFGSTTDFIADIGGLNPGTQHDELVVSGSLVLDGDLLVNVLPGFTPSGGQMFTIIRAPVGVPITGNFVTTPPNWVALVISNEVVLEYTGP
jgi:hypothetical protein